MTHTAKKYLIVIIAMIVIAVLVFWWQLRDEIYLDFNYEERYPYKQEFAEHIKGYDEIRSDHDPFNPDFAYLKNGHLVGVYTSAGSEWGNRQVFYFLDDTQQLIKVIDYVDGNESASFYGDEVVADLLVVYDVVNHTAIGYGRTQNGDRLDSKEWAKKYNAETFSTSYNRWIKQFDTAKACGQQHALKGCVEVIPLFLEE